MHPLHKPLFRTCLKCPNSIRETNTDAEEVEHEIVSDVCRKLKNITYPQINKFWIDFSLLMTRYACIKHSYCVHTLKTEKVFKNDHGNYIFFFLLSVPLAKFFMTSPASSNTQQQAPLFEQKNEPKRVDDKDVKWSLCCRRRKMKSFIHWTERQVFLRLSPCLHEILRLSRVFFLLKKLAKLVSGNLSTKKFVSS